MSLVSYNGKYVSIGSKIADYKLPFLSISVTGANWNEFGVCCTTLISYITISIYSNVAWTASVTTGSGYTTNSNNGAFGNSTSDIEMAPNEGQPGRNGEVTFSSPGLADVVFFAYTLDTGQTC